jgi:PPOX class probable F420-dependent enzyme
MSEPVTDPRTRPWASLQGERYIQLTTFRKDGRAVATPVWFVDFGGRLVVYTVATSGKVRRIRHTPRVEVAASDRRGRTHGPRLRGTARLLPAEEWRAAEQALNRKYPLKRLLNLARRLARRQAGITYLEIRPA